MNKNQIKCDGRFTTIKKKVLYIPREWSRSITTR